MCLLCVPQPLSPLGPWGKVDHISAIHNQPLLLFVLVEQRQWQRYRLCSFDGRNWENKCRWGFSSLQEDTAAPHVYDWFTTKWQQKKETVRDGILARVMKVPFRLMKDYKVNWATSFDGPKLLWFVAFSGPSMTFKNRRQAKSQDTLENVLKNRLFFKVWLSSTL